MVGAEDVGALAAALERVLFDEEFATRCRANVERVRARFLWGTTLAPLRDFVAAPRHAPDLREAMLARGEGSLIGPAPRARKRYGFTHNVELVRHHLQHGGVRVVFRKVMARLRRN
jgi:hypothetical protein